MDVRPKWPAPPHPLLGRGGGRRGVVTMALTTGGPQLSLWSWGASASPFFLSPLPPQPHTGLPSPSPPPAPAGAPKPRWVGSPAARQGPGRGRASKRGRGQRASCSENPGGEGGADPLPAPRAARGIRAPTPASRLHSGPPPTRLTALTLEAGLAVS